MKRDRLCTLTDWAHIQHERALTPCPVCAALHAARVETVQECAKVARGYQDEMNEAVVRLKQHKFYDQEVVDACDREAMAAEEIEQRIRSLLPAAAAPTPTLGPPCLLCGYREPDNTNDAGRGGERPGAVTPGSGGQAPPSTSPAASPSMETVACRVCGGGQYLISAGLEPNRMRFHQKGCFGDQPHRGGKEAT